MKKSYILTVIILTILGACKFPAVKGSAPEVLLSRIVDSGRIDIVESQLFMGETPQLYLELSDEDANISDITLKHIYKGETVYQQNEPVQQYQETADFHISFEQTLSGPEGQWTLEYIIADKNGLSTTGSILYDVSSLADCLNITKYTPIEIIDTENDKVSVLCDFDNTSGRVIDTMKFKVRVDFTDGSSDESIHAIRNNIPGRTSSDSFIIIFPDSLTVKDVSIVSDSLEILIY
ncbi:MULTISPECIES: hypothetical protein [unclassified Oceanispirochaeta]|uniref:hypothetical protein n=1 Tax=unclassified Oceanispirochaeta TaxID=2635722 RepID=UPI000E09CC95|nr:MULTISPECIES: hypothetical protein [unclassified Oceanispirochaeta]MBF9014403.1 hypothetical protein [Oceanispirochaeta sp. M2]NPD71289.1 hypothetical protein [Oceanispirochaeta sp. M1]RDG33670.1 hypothetical protein DV872_04165 [Oceanispirochaeta sp. M1]